MAKNPRKALDKPAAEVIARIVQQLSDNVYKRLDALKKGEDPEALHDARVDVKRLRVWLKHGKTHVATSRRAREALRAFTKTSNPMRDREVMIAWLKTLNPDGNRRIGVEEVIGTAEAAMPALRQQVLAVARDLQAHPVALAPKPKKSAEPQCFGEWLADRVTEHQLTLIQDFEHLPEGLHQARLTGKHLRYLIESLKGAEDADDAVACLKEMQEGLGDAHDLVAMRQHLPDLFSETLADIGFDSIRRQIASGQSLSWRTPACWPGMRYIIDQLNSAESLGETNVEQWRDENLAGLTESLGTLRERLLKVS